MLQILLDLKESFGEVKERTANLSKSIDRISNDLQDMRNEMVTSKTVWSIGAILVTVLLGLGGLIYRAVTTLPYQNSQPVSASQDLLKQADPIPPPSESSQVIDK